MEFRKQANVIRVIIIVTLFLLLVSTLIVFGNKLSHDTYHLKIIEKPEQTDNNDGNEKTNTDRVGAGFFANINRLTTAVVKKNKDDTYLQIDIEPEKISIFNGFGFDTEISIPDNAYFELEAYNRGPAVKVYINITDGSPAGGEIFYHSKVLQARSWNKIKIPLRRFIRNVWQPENASRDGNFDTKGIRKVALSTHPTTPLHIDLKYIQFSWGIPGFIIISFLVFAMFIGVLLIIRTQSSCQESKLTSIFFTQRSLSRIIFVGLTILAVFFFHQKLVYSDSLVYIMYIILLLIIFLDDFVIVPDTFQPIWAYRYLIILYIFIYLRVQSGYWLPLLALLITIAHFPFLSLNNNTFMFMGIIPTILSVLLAPPAFELRTKIMPVLLIFSGTIISYFIINVIRSKEDRLEADRRNQLFNGIFEHSSDAIILTDKKGNILSANNGFYKMMGTETKKSTGVSFFNYLDESSKKKITLQQGQFDATIRDKESNSHTVLLRVQPLYKKQTVSGYILIATDITIRKKMEEQLQKLSVEDSLTGVYNRRFFNDNMAEEWKRAKRNNSILSVLLIDVDFFKKFNDTYGHQKGDVTLIRIADILNQSTKRPADKTARYGGEEFIITLPDTEGANLHLLAENIRTSIESLNIKHGASEISDHVTVSIGGATLRPDDTYTIDKFIKHADDALYEAKNKGRNQIVLKHIT